MYQAKESYTPTEARRANDELDRLVAARTLTSKQGRSSSTAHCAPDPACSEGELLGSGRQAREG